MSVVAIAVLFICAYTSAMLAQESMDGLQDEQMIYCWPTDSGNIWDSPAHIALILCDPATDFAEPEGEIDWRDLMMFVDWLTDSCGL